MNAVYEVVDVSAWRSLRVEELGSKPGKQWLEDTSGDLWLFKPVIQKDGTT